MRFVFCFALALMACDSPPAPDVTPAGPTRDPNAFDLPRYCAAMCERTASCSMEAAKHSASLGGDKTEAALTAARAEQKALQDQCLAGCQSETVDPLEKTRARRAQYCLQQSDCAGLERCLAAL